ncbi:MAG: NAD-dependent epimerase/dehydratase family protein, partial [Acidobacteriota bacterium]|nr:NAD-dependent epimerase/dehydratase family protein [Acidobacteriota bacterium]
MKVFVTGATGLLGFAIVNDLVAAGHQVTGLARFDASAKKLADAGAQSLRGDIGDLGVLRAGAAKADGVIHTAFYHQISHIPLGTRLSIFLGGPPTGIVERFLQAALEADRRALEAMGGV